MTREELQTILDKHKKWVFDEAGGERADLRGAYLREAYLRGAYLSGADLRGAYLRGADLRGADLRGAYLREAYLRGAYLRGADLRGAYLRGADLSGADLSGADLRGAYLSGADLSGADLRGAYLSGAYLRGADLRGADLSGAYLRGAKIEDQTLNKFFPISCPDSGAFVGWKKCSDNRIVKLIIPEDAKRCSAFGRKCRCDKAVVLDIQDLDGNSIDGPAISQHDSAFLYVKGQEVSVPDFDDDRRNECSTGIHFFITRQEAVNY